MNKSKTKTVKRAILFITLLVLISQIALAKDFIIRNQSDATDNYFVVNGTTGNVGVGTANPTDGGAGYSILSVNGDTAGVVEFKSGDVRQSQLYSTTTRFIAGSTTNIPFSLTTNNNIKFTITEDGNIGIGELNPNEKLTVNGNVSLNNTLFVTEEGNVGIGTASPTTELEIVGSLTVDEIVGDSVFDIYSEVSNRGRISLTSGTAATSNQVQFLTNSAVRQVIDYTGQVGIGTQNPNELLTVNGNVSLNNTLFVTEAGNVGIGTSSPGEKLEVDGNINVTTGNDICIQGGNCLSTVAASSIDGTGSANHIAFFADSNTLTYDDDTLVYIPTTNKLGIGSNTPNEMLTVGGNASINNTLFVKQTGNVGIGTTAPDGKLHIKEGSGSDATASSNADTLVVQAVGTSPGISLFAENTQDRYIYFGDFADDDAGRIAYDASDRFRFYTSDTERVIIDSSGKVGIGTTDPNATLHVDGTINVTEGNDICVDGGVCLSAAGGADAAGTEGAIQFYEGGNLGGNASQFKLDKSTGRVGIGTVGPTVVLDIRTEAESTDGLMVYASDYQYAKLLASQMAGAGNPLIQAGDSGIMFTNSTLNGDTGFTITPWRNSASGIRIDAEGDVGIGIAAPASTLDVEGNITLNERIDFANGGYMVDTGSALILGRT